MKKREKAVAKTVPKALFFANVYETWPWKALHHAWAQDYLIYRFTTEIGEREWLENYLICWYTSISICMSIEMYIAVLASWNPFSLLELCCLYSLQGWGGLGLGIAFAGIIFTFHFFILFSMLLILSLAFNVSFAGVLANEFKPCWQSRHCLFISHWSFSLEGRDFYCWFVLLFMHGRRFFSFVLVDRCNNSCLWCWFGCQTLLIT